MSGVKTIWQPLYLIHSSAQTTSDWVNNFRSTTLDTELHSKQWTNLVSCICALHKPQASTKQICHSNLQEFRILSQYQSNSKPSSYFFGWYPLFQMVASKHFDVSCFWLCNSIQLSNQQKSAPRPLIVYSGKSYPLPFSVRNGWEIQGVACEREQGMRETWEPW